MVNEALISRRRFLTVLALFLSNKMFLKEFFVPIGSAYNYYQCVCYQDYQIDEVDGEYCQIISF